MLRVLLFVVACLVLGAPAVARARDDWSDPYPGVRHLHRTSGDVDAHILLVDLRRPNLSLVSTPQGARGIATRDFAERFDADIAINANFFDTRNRSCGLAVADGVAWDDSYSERCDMSFAFGRLNEAEAFDSAGELLTAPFAWATDVVSGKPWLIRDGVIQVAWLGPRHITFRHPRTALGLTRDKKTLIILAADGRRPGVPGLTGTHAAELLLEFGAHNALNLDGGGSTELFIRGEGGVQNHPSDGRNRPVSSHLGIRFKAEDTSWQSADVRLSEREVTLASGQRTQLVLRGRNTGRSTWHPGSVRFSVSDDRPSPFFDIQTWEDNTTPLVIREEISPGEEFAFALTVAAPSAPGLTKLELEARIGSRTLSGAPASSEITIEADHSEVPAIPAVESPEEPVVAAAQINVASAMGTDWFWNGLLVTAVAGFLGLSLPRHSLRNRRNTLSR